MKSTTGVRRTHIKSCPARGGGRCKCNGGWEADVYDKSARRRIRKTFPTAAAARAWRTDVEHGIRRGTMRASEPTTVNEAADVLFPGMESGAVRTRSGDPYKPSTIRSYREAFELHACDDLGAMKLGDVKRRHVQQLADRLLADGKSPSAVRNVLMPLRVLFRRAIRDELVAVNPCTGIELPANRSARPEIRSVESAAALMAAIPDLRDRAIWATAFYAGLRRGELMALRWRDLDTGNGRVHVERSYDPKNRVYVDPKSRAGRRQVPFAGALRDAVLDLRVSLDQIDPDALAFGDTPTDPFSYDPMIARARAAWKQAQLEPVGLHVARHTCASVMIAAGVNIKALSTFMGHASIQITLDRYGHLLPGSIDEATTLLDAFIERNAGLTAGQLEESLHNADSVQS